MSQNVNYEWKVIPMFFEKINLKDNINDILSLVCRDFDLGIYLSYRIIDLGYEDFNYVLKASSNNYLVKIFSKTRKVNECEMYIRRIIEALSAGVQHPKLYKSNQGYLHKIKSLRLCVMEYIDGQDFYSLGTRPSIEEFKEIIKQTALINKINFKPKRIYDSWAIMSFPKSFKKKSKYLFREDYDLIRDCLSKFSSVNIKKLPHCFVHGDLSASNIIKDNNNKIWIIDFAVSNYYPRIVDIATILANLCFDANNLEKTNQDSNIVINEYEKHIKLNDEEIHYLTLFTKISHAMFVLGASYEKVKKKNTSDENNYLLNLGRIGLRQGFTK